MRSALFLGILASSMFAFAISYSTAWSVRVSSSTTYSMVGALNKLPIAISGMVFFGAERKAVNAGNILSVIIGTRLPWRARLIMFVAFFSGIMYSLAQIQQKKKKPVEETPLKDTSLTLGASK